MTSPEQSRPGGALAAATALRPEGAGRYAVTLDTWGVGDRPNGGYLLAVAARAAIAESPHPHPVAVSGHFLAPPGYGDAAAEVEQLRTGRTTTSSRVRLLQQGRGCLETLVTTARLGQGPDLDGWNDDSRPEIAPIESCVPAIDRTADGTPIPLMRHIELRLDRGTLGWAKGKPAGRAEMRGWFRLGDGAEPDPLALLLAADALPPTVFGLGRYGWAPTVELTFLLRALPVAGWLAVEVRSRLLADGWFDEEATIWDAAGRLVAQARQLARVGRGS